MVLSHNTTPIAQMMVCLSMHPHSQKLNHLTIFHYGDLRDTRPLTHIISCFNDLFFLYKMIHASLKQLSKKPKKDVEILADQAVFKLWVKKAKISFSLIVQELLGLPKFYCYFLSSLDDLL